MPELKLPRRDFLIGGLSAAIAPTVAATAANTPVDVVLGGKSRLRGLTPGGRGGITISQSGADVAIVTLTGTGGETIAADSELRLLARDVPGIETGIQYWRYAPWKAWTRPAAVARLADLHEDDVQLLFWREHDGSFVVAIPLSGAGFRSTIGRVDGRFAVRAAALAEATAPASLPLLAIGHGDDLHTLVGTTYRAAYKAMNKPGPSGRDKRLPDALRRLGWNSWNASELGHKLDAKLLIDAATTLRAAHVPIGWMLVDDGYFDHRDQRIRSFAADRTRFPQGFPATIAELKNRHGIRHVGAWLALNGYWHGIDPAGPLGERYKADLFSWTEHRDVTDAASPLRTNSFIRADRPAVMARYYDEHLSALKTAGFDFIKVDNQLVVERMAKRNFPIWQLATAMHDGMNAAAQHHFGNAMINCMDLTADAYLNFGTTPVARAVEDYFSYKTGETYDLEKGNAAAHVMQAIYNALYVGELAIPDFDMFETTNPNARLHAVARAANNGPIYVTDVPGKHDIALLRSLTLADGTTLRADRPLLPCADCLFQLQAAKPFKAFSGVGEVGLLMVANLADADRVTGSFSAADMPGFGSRAVIAYEHLSGRIEQLAPGASVPVDLPRFGVMLWSLHDAASGVAIFGRRDKINGPASVAGTRREAGATLVDLHELGPVTAFTAARPNKVTIDGVDQRWSWRDGLLAVEATVTDKPGMIKIVHAIRDGSAA